MSIKELVSIIYSYKEENYLIPPCNSLEIKKFEHDNNIVLPKEYVELILEFNGGEVFIPGTKIYGILDEEYSLKKINSKENRKIFSIPNNYLIIAKLNFGDFICVNLNSPNEIIQWDHENNTLFFKWDTMFDWLSDTINDYARYKEDVE